MVAGGTNCPSGSGNPQRGSVGATAQGIPKPSPRSVSPPSAACGVLAPSVTSVPAGSGQATTPVGHGKASSPGPSSGTVAPLTMTGCPVDGSTTTGGIVVANGTASTGGMLSVTKTWGERAAMPWTI